MQVAQDQTEEQQLKEQMRAAAQRKEAALREA
jgi:hypothetical protein